MINIAYFGSPEIAATALDQLISAQDDFRISLVVTQPDRPAGKKLILQKTKVKELAQKENRALFDKSIQDNYSELSNSLKDLNIDLAIVYAYGAYLPFELLSIPKYGFINIHFSLLPKYRGASPIAYPLILGDIETGVTLIQLNEVLDGGDIISQKKTEILQHETRIELEKRLTIISIPMMKEYITQLQTIKKAPLQSQEKKDITSTRLIKKNDGYISFLALQKALLNKPLNTDEIPGLIKEYTAKYPDLNYSEYYQNSALLIYNYYRGLYSWPGIWTTISTSKGEKRLKLTQLTYSSNKLIITRVQLEGKNETDFFTFNKAYKIM